MGAEGRKFESCRPDHRASATPAEAVDQVQLRRTFTAEENAKIVAFLRTLTGDQPSFALPILPASVEATPRPSPFD